MGARLGGAQAAVAGRSTHGGRNLAAFAGAAAVTQGAQRVRRRHAALPPGGVVELMRQWAAEETRKRRGWGPT
jgi:hypothetical protein